MAQQQPEQIPGPATILLKIVVFLFRVIVGGVSFLLALRRRVSHGSARWAQSKHLRALAGPVGCMIGRAGHVLRFAEAGHLVTIAPTRSGKGVSGVIPNLLTYPGSVFVLDPKAENFAVTNRARRQLGQEVYALDPWGITGAASACFNPMDWLRPAVADAVDDAAVLADMLVVSDDREGEDSHWDGEAKGLLEGLILYVAAHAPPDARTLGMVRQVLTLPPQEFEAVLDEMAASTAMGGLVARAAARIRQKDNRERSGVISTAQRHTKFLDSPRIEAALSRTDFDLAALKAGKISVFVTLPAEQMGAYRRWVRLMVGMGLKSITRTGAGSGPRALMLLDEFPTLGRMEPVEAAMGLLGGYGVHLWLFLQDLSQLKGVYAKWETFLGNAAVLQTFGSSDKFTLEYLSDLLGKSTVLGKNVGWLLPTATSRTETSRPLMFPDEIRTMPGNEQLLFVRGVPPIRCRKLSYLQDGEFRGKFDRNPMQGN